MRSSLAALLRLMGWFMCGRTWDALMAHTWSTLQLAFVPRAFVVGFYCCALAAHEWGSLRLTSASLALRLWRNCAALVDCLPVDRCVHAVELLLTCVRRAYDLYVKLVGARVACRWLTVDLRSTCA